MVWDLVSGIASILGSLLAAMFFCWVIVSLVRLVRQPSGGLPLVLVLALAAATALLHLNGFAVTTPVFAAVGAAALWIGDQAPMLTGRARGRTPHELHHG